MASCSKPPQATPHSKTIEAVRFTLQDHKGSASELLNAPLTTTVGYDDPQSPPPATCNDFLRLRAQGHYDPSPVGDNTQSALHGVCTTLEHMSRAIASKEGFVQDFDLQRDGLDELPEAVRHVWQAEEAGTAVQALQSGQFTVAKRSRPRQLLLYSQGQQDERTGLLLQLVGRGDINHDGYEDLLLLVEADSGGASLDYMSKLFVLSRRESKVLLQVLSSAPEH